MFIWISVLRVLLFYALHLRCILGVHLCWVHLLIEMTRELNPIEIGRWCHLARLWLWIWMYRVMVLRRMLGLLGRVCCNIIWQKKKAWGVMDTHESNIPKETLMGALGFNWRGNLGARLEQMVMFFSGSKVAWGRSAIKTYVHKKRVRRSRRIRKRISRF